jgi:hypothetical protein
MPEMVTQIAMVLGPALWLGVTVLVLAVCRVAGRADAYARRDPSATRYG